VGSDDGVADRAAAAAAVASGTRSVAIAGDVHAPVHTGDVHLRVDMDPPEAAILSPAPVYDRCQLDRFQGREWLAERVDDFIATESRGYFVLDALVGMGKTAFLASLVKQRGYLYHFVEQAPGPQGVSQAFRSLNAQLILRYGLTHLLYGERLLPKSADLPQFFEAALFDAARARIEAKRAEPIVLVIDALDELHAPHGTNPLAMPKHLPEGVYILVSFHTGTVELDVDPPLRTVALVAGSNDNRADVRRYVESALGWPGVVASVARHDIDPKALVETLVERSKGLWIYLHYVLGDVERGEPLDLRELPDGLWVYYGRTLRRLREAAGGDWYWHLAVLATLAVAREPLPVPLLRELAAVSASVETLLEITEGPWRPFIVREGSSAVPALRLFHASLREFLEGHSGESDRRLAKATLDAHDRIAERYLRRWGGLSAALPLLTSSSSSCDDDRYGVRHLMTHLLCAGRRRDGDRLLALERLTSVERPGWWGHLRDLFGKSERRRALWHTLRTSTGVSDFVADVNLLTEHIPNIEGPALDSEVVEGHVRYALVRSSINSLATAIPAKLLAALVDKKVLTASQALAEAYQLFGHHRTNAFEHILPAIARIGQGQMAFDLALASGKDDGHMLVVTDPFLDSSLMNEVLKRTLPRFPQLRRIFDGVLAEPRCADFAVAVVSNALEVARTRKAAEHHQYVTALNTLCAVLGRAPAAMRAEVAKKATDLARAVSDPPARARLLAQSLAWLPAATQEHIAKAELDRLSVWLSDGGAIRAHLARFVPDFAPTLLAELRNQGRSRERTALVTGLISALPVSMQRNVIDEVLRQIADLPSISDQWELARDLAITLSRCRRYDDVRTVLKLLPDHERYPLLTDLVREWPLEERLAAVRETISPTDGHPSTSDLWILVRSIAEAGRVDEALTVARDIDSVSDRAKAMAVLIDFVSEHDQGRILRELHVAVRTIGDPETRRRARTNLLAAANLIDDAERSIRDDRDAVWAALRLGERLLALAELVPRLGPPQARPLLREAMRLAARTYGYRPEGLAALAPYLDERQRRKALALVRKKPPGIGSVSAMVALARHAPTDTSAEIAREATEWSDRLGALERLHCLARISEIVPPDKRVVFVCDLVASAVRIDRVNTLDLVEIAAPHLTPAMIEATVDILTDPARRQQPYVPPSQLRPLGHRWCIVREPQAILPAMRFASKERFSGADAFERGLALTISDARFREIFVRSEGSLGARVSQTLCVAAREDAQAALAVCRGLGRSDLAQVILRLEGCLPAQEWGERLAGAVVDRIGDLHSHTPLNLELSALSSGLASAPIDASRFFLGAILKQLAERPRQSLLSFLRYFPDVVTRVGGPAAAPLIARAIDDVGRWWP
jgi:hypothetical protein